MVFISSLSFAEVVCESPETVGGENGTEANNIKANCNVHSTDNTVSVSGRDVNVNQIAKVLEAGPSDTKDSSGATPDTPDTPGTPGTQ